VAKRLHAHKAGFWLVLNRVTVISFPKSGLFFRDFVTLFYSTLRNWPFLSFTSHTVYTAGVLNANATGKFVCTCTPWAKKTYHFIFHYNSRISWWIFILFISLETKINTLQCSYLTSHCSVHFIELLCA